MLQETLPQTQAPSSVQEQLKVKEKQLAWLAMKMFVLITLLWLTLGWLSLYKITINLFIAGIPILAIYTIVFYKYFKKVRRLGIEIEKLEVLKNLEKDINYVRHDILYFRRH